MKYHFKPGAWAWSGWALVPWEAPPISLHTAHAATLEIVIIRTSFVGMRYVTLSFHTSAVLLEINLVTTSTSLDDDLTRRQPHDWSISSKENEDHWQQDHLWTETESGDVCAELLTQRPNLATKITTKVEKTEKARSTSGADENSWYSCWHFETIVVVLSYWSRDNVYRNIDKIRKCLAAILSQQIRHRYHTN